MRMMSGFFTSFARSSVMLRGTASSATGVVEVLHVQAILHGFNLADGAGKAYARPQASDDAGLK